MNPSNPVCLTAEAVDITMQSSEYFYFKFEVDGVFQSLSAKEFHPHLPFDHQFKAGSVWPNLDEYPKGAKPMTTGTFTYTWEPEVESEELPTQSAGTIRVNSGSN